MHFKLIVKYPLKCIFFIKNTHFFCTFPNSSPISIVWQKQPQHRGAPAASAIAAHYIFVCSRNCGGTSMNALNQIILEGNVVRQPEKKELSNGTHVCMIPIAVNRRYKTREGELTDEVSYFDVDTFGNLADVCSEWCPKGRGVRVVGRLKQDRWKNEEGKSRSKVTVIAEHVEFKPFFKKNDDGTEDSAESSEGPQSADSGTPAPTKKQKLAMLAEAAAAAQSEQESGEDVAF
jgi:single-strand DNA-binding protein